MSADSVDDHLSYDAVAPEEVEMVDLFAGPGGLDVAAKWLGIPAVGIEVDDDACRTRIAAKLGTRHADVRIPRLLDMFPNAKILTGGPPCQTFSVAGAGAGRRALTQVLAFADRIAAGNRQAVLAELAELDDERTGLVLQPLIWILDAIDRKRPFETIVLEQVPTVLPVWHAYRRILFDLDLGYDVEVDLVHTEQFGVPQTRRRAILIASRVQEAHFPGVTHRPYNKNHSRSGGKTELLDWENMGDALRRPAWAKHLDLPKRPSSFEVVSNYGTGGDPKLRGRRKSTEPSATITGKVRRNRIYAGAVELDRLHPREAGRLQTFPLDYPWSEGDPYQQVGNAIPPRVGVHILAAARFGKKPNEADLNRAVGGSWNDEHDLQSTLEPLDKRIDVVDLSRQSELFTVSI
ncbi:DNA cytosine methyltransferase [Nocardia huaxiensis]|uniref:DNA cytosine methyltransferase n=1 Tax=Nocardia huaxiensis TaxID=2755382 RepID=UPI001E348862|nr:DNA cytosine methyltransferase [Nocardia huaxiensis]UFS96409.1 DNA cytosine methyltransferase [Nocardia huaxiensis]